MLRISVVICCVPIPFLKIFQDAHQVSVLWTFAQHDVQDLLVHPARCNYHQLSNLSKVQELKFQGDSACQPHPYRFVLLDVQCLLVDVITQGDVTFIEPPDNDAKVSTGSQPSEDWLLPNTKI